MSLVKYRVKEVAADFEVAPKVIVEIISKYFEKPKSNTQVLTEDELNLLFEYMTVNNQIQSLEQVFAVQPTPKAEPVKEEPKAEVKEEPKAEVKKEQPKTQTKPQAAPQLPKAEKAKEPERKRERRVVDTSAVQVNSARFDDRVDSLISERAQNFQGGKQRIGGKKGQQQNKKDMRKGNKARNEEQEKMRRLQMEVARKAPVTVKIPDEITVGELASRMKKTAGEVIK